MALNLARNSRVFFTSNVNSTTGVINATGFTSSNTQEIQVLDGFTFSQNTTQDTVTLSEAGDSPVRGQRSFNTALAPVDFSMSTYLRPAKSGSEIVAEEAVLWNALFSSKSYKSTVAFSAATSFAVVYAEATGRITYTASGVLTHGLKVGDIVNLTGLTTSNVQETAALNGPAVVVSIPASPAATGSTAVFELLTRYPTAISTITTAASPTLYTSAWAPAIPNVQSIVSSAVSNTNSLQKFGMIFVIDNVTYFVDNCAMNQATVDFGLDAISTVAWTGQATTLREVTNVSLSGTAAISAAANVLTNISSTENIFIGNVIKYTATALTGSYTSATGNTTTVTKIDSANGLTTSASDTGTANLTDVRVFNFTASGTSVGTVVQSGSIFTAPITALTSTVGISVGDIVTATAGVGNLGSGTVKVTKVDSATAITVESTATITAGTVTALLVQIATLTSTTNTLNFAAKNTTAPYITNKLSTVAFKTLNALGGAAATTYKIALTGGSITINNNITYLTPANLAVVNTPAVYYTGTRAISGTLNAYLKTGSGEGGTGQLLADMLNASTTASAIEPIASLLVSVGGAIAPKVELDMPSVTFTIPTVDAQQVISTAINFTAQGSTGTAYDINDTNELTIRYYAA
jgi:hypothetical protein